MKDQIIKIDNKNVLVTTNGKHTLTDDDINCIKESMERVIKEIDSKKLDNNTN